MSVIVEKYKNLLIPTPYIEKVVAANTACMGLAFASDGDIVTATLDEGADVEVVQNTLAEYKEHAVIYHFGNVAAGKTLNKDDIQPFVLLKNDGDDPVVVAFLNGDFPQFKQEASEHTPEFFVALTHLQPKFQKIFNACEQTIKKFMDEMADPVFAQDMMLACGGNGNITILASNGEIVRWTADPKAAAFPWGKTTDTYGFVEGKYNPTAAEGNSKKLTLVGKKDRTKTAVPETGTKPGPAAVQIVPPADTGTPVKKVQCPKSITNKHEKKRWYHKNAGWCPSNFKDYPEVECKLPYKAFEDIKPAATSTAPAAVTGYKPFTNPDQKPAAAKDTAAKHIPKPSVATTREFVPIIGADRLKVLHDDLLKQDWTKTYFDNTGKAMPIDPKKIFEAQGKYPPAWEQMGLKSLEAALGWDAKDYMRLDHDILAMLLTNISAALIEELTYDESEEEQRKAM